MQGCRPSGRNLVFGLLIALAGCADDVDPWAAAYEPCEGLMQRDADAHVDDKTWGEILEVAKANGVSAEQIEGMVG